MGRPGSRRQPVARGQLAAMARVRRGDPVVVASAARSRRDLHAARGASGRKMPASGAAGRTRAGDAVIGTPILALAIGCLAWVIPELAVQSATVVHYRDLPSEIVSASVYRWRDAAVPL